MSASRPIQHLETAARIVVVFEPDEPGYPALRQAVALALEADDAEVHVLHVQGTADTAFPPERGSSVRELLEGWCNGSSPRLVNHFRPGSLGDALPRLASEVDATLVVVPDGFLEGEQGRPLRGRLRALGHGILVAQGASSGVRGA
ncbi:MAG: universal stress protein [Myxococcales bacterium]|jgi:hypothetical protein